LCFLLKNKMGSQQTEQNLPLSLVGYAASGGSVPDTNRLPLSA